MRISIPFFTVIALLTAGCNNQHHKTYEQGDELLHITDDDRNEHEKQVQKKYKSTAQLKTELTEAGYQIFDYVDSTTGDTVLMQQYFMAFLKRGPKRSQDSITAAQLQEAHLAHLGRMYAEGYADISGPFGDNQDIRGITIYNVPTLKMADSLANLDPMVKAGRLVIEVRPWWAAKGFPLR
jgi:uncharacterized protein YciI